MAYVNKTSLRDKFDRIKSEFSALPTKQKLSPEILALFNAMILLFEILIAIFLENNTKKDGQKVQLTATTNSKGRVGSLLQRVKWQGAERERRSL